MCVAHPNSKFLSTFAICRIKCYVKSLKATTSISVPTFGADGKSKHELFSCKNVQGNGEGILHWSLFNQEQSSPPARQEQGKGTGKRVRAINQQIFSIKSPSLNKSTLTHEEVCLSSRESEGLVVPQDIQRYQQVHQTQTWLEWGHSPAPNHPLPTGFIWAQTTSFLLQSSSKKKPWQWTKLSIMS